MTCGNRTHTDSQQAQTWHTDWVLSERYHTHTHIYFILILQPSSYFPSDRWASGQAASDRIRGLRPWDEELDAVPVHPQPQSVLLMRCQRQGIFQLGGSSAAWTPQLLLQTSLRLHCRGIWLWAGWALHLFCWIFIDKTMHKRNVTINISAQRHFSLYIVGVLNIT